METEVEETDDGIVPIRFLPYLWGMETVNEDGDYIRSVQVLTVPMRNGNEYQEDDEATRVSSYRTYEEWKHRELSL